MNPFDLRDDRVSKDHALVILDDFRERNMAHHILVIVDKLREQMQ